MITSNQNGKIRRSRAGCNECRRLHRRCDEKKPICGICLRDGKECSYARALTFVDHAVRGSGRKPPHQRMMGSQQEGHQQDVVLQTLTSKPSSSLGDSEMQKVDNTRARGNVQQQRLYLPGIPQSLEWLPWLNAHHRMLIHHFAHITCATCSIDTRQHQRLCSAVLPLALDTTSGFHLLAAMLCVASTHRRALDIVQDDNGIDEAAYWEAMAVGHLRKQQLPRSGDDVAENSFAATALLLSVRDILAGGERARTWRMHLDGALFVLNGNRGRADNREGIISGESNAKVLLRRLAQAMDTVAMMFSKPSFSRRHQSRRLCPLPNEATMISQDSADGAEDIDEILGVSSAVLDIIMQVDEVAADMQGLMRIEHHATLGVLGMEDLWGSLMKRVVYLLDKSEFISAALSSVGPSPTQNPETVDLTEADELRLLNKAFHYISLSQIQVRLLGLLVDNIEVQDNLRSALSCLQQIRLRDHACPAQALLQPVFVIGCYACSPEVQQQCIDLLAALKRKYGRENAHRARDLLLEFWSRREHDARAVRRRHGVPDWPSGIAAASASRIPNRIEEYEWTDLMIEKGWDLSLW